MTDAREWRAREHDALLAVLDLHRPIQRQGREWCVECYPRRGHDYAPVSSVWPCATVRAINESLGVTDD